MSNFEQFPQPINRPQIDQLQTSPETEADRPQFFSHFRNIVETKARENVPEFAELIIEIVSEIDRQGIESYDVVKTPEADFPVSVVNVTELFRRILADKVPHRQVAAEKSKSEVEAAVKKPERRTTVFLPGISPPPVGHPFTLWDYVYQQVYTDLPRVIGAWRRGEPLPEIEVRVFGSANSDWGRVTPEWVQRVKAEGFKPHGEQVAAYLKTLLPEVDYLRLDGISMGALVAMEAVELLSEEERAKMQVMLDNPADNLFHNRLLRMIRALQLPLGFGLDGARIFAANPQYRALYGGEKGFLAQLNPFMRKKQAEKAGVTEENIAPNDDPEQLKLKKQAAIAEAVKIVQAALVDTDKRVFVRRGASDLTTSTFGDVMSLVRNKLSRWNAVRGIGRRLQFTVSAGHQRDNFMVDKWAKLLQRAQSAGVTT